MLYYVVTYILNLSITFVCNTSNFLNLKILPSCVECRVVCDQNTQRHTPEDSIVDNHLHGVLKFHWISLIYLYLK
jgi:hypothetical protein